MDDFIRDLLADANKAEARSWLAGGTGRTLGELDADESKKFVDDLYARGATEVIAVEIDDLGEEGQHTGHLIVALPAEKEKREATLGYISDWAAVMGFDRVEDSGQTHEYVLLD